MASNNRVLTVQMPESLYDSFIDLAWERRITAGKLVRTEIERMLEDRASPLRWLQPSFVAESVRRSQDHTYTTALHPLFDNRSAEEGWHAVARLLADEVNKLEILHDRVIAAIRDEGPKA